MPEISKFYGIHITMYYDDHNPPLFHAEYDGYKAIVNINDCVVIKGFFPHKQLKLLLAWAEIHKEELLKNWELLAAFEQPNKINPLV